jgi:RHS repeat-associated protein
MIANGNRTQKTKGTDTWIYIYDYSNNLTDVTKNSVVLGEYLYDGDGKRIQVIQDNKTTTYIYGGSKVLHEENTIGTADYIYGPEGLLARKTSINGESHTFYYHTDHLGSTRLVTDGNTAIISDATYHPFGESTTEGSENYLFTGKQKDTTGLYYFGARYYDPEIGQFTTQDPLPGQIQSPQTLNRYIYCLNNPLKYIDPAGMSCEYVILPDGTISRELCALYDALEKGLDNLTEEDLEDINEFLAGSDNDKLQAVIRILEKANISHKYDRVTRELTIEVGGITFFVEFANIREMGKIATGAKTGRRFIVLNSKISKAGDLFLTLGHELVHAYMIAFRGDLIDTVTQRFGELGNEAFNEHIAYQWEVSAADHMWDSEKWKEYISPGHLGGIWWQFDMYERLWPLVRRGITYTQRLKYLCVRC